MTHAAGSYFVIPFLRPQAATAPSGALVVEAAPAAGNAPAQVEVRAVVNKPNGSLVGEESVRTAGRAEVWVGLFANDCGVLHVESAGGEIHAALETAGQTHGFADVDSLAGVDFRIAATNPAEPFAVLANATEQELFVFVNDRQGPFIPPGGCARIEIPVPGGPLHVTVDHGDAVLAYEGAPVLPTT
jgi:hypothetical protein